MIAKMLLESGLNPDLPESSISAQSIAFDAGHFNVLLMLLQSNLTFPFNLDISKCSGDIQQFIDLAKTLRKALKSNETEIVEDILHNNKDLRHFYTTTNESAPKFAIENNLIDMYEVLLTNKVLFGPHEDVIAIMNKLNYDEKRHLREIHFKHSIDMPEKHINTLMANSYVGHEEVTNVQEKLDCVQNAFKLLNENPFIKIILLIVAASKKFRIIFDFNRDSVELIDPTAGAFTAGLFYLSGRMYIGAKQLLDKTRQNEAIATIAHELCHYAMNLVYNNDANPYKQDDQESQENVEEVSTECQEKSGTEDIVDMVYECYPEDMYHAELIVRVPHMMAYYHDQPEKKIESKENFKGLYKLYEEKVFPEMEKALPEIEARTEKEMVQKDKEIHKLRKRFYLSIIIFIILLIGVGTFAFIFPKNAYEYQNLSPKYKMLIESHPVIYAGIEVNFHDILMTNSSAFNELKSNAIRYLLTSKDALNIDTEEFSNLRSFVEYNWTTLAEPLREKFLSKNLVFQNESVKVGDLYQNYPKSFNFIDQRDINRTLFNETLRLGDMVESDVKFYIQRRFIDENINLAYHKFTTENLNENFGEYYNSFIAQDYEEYHEVLHEIKDSESYISKREKFPFNSDEFRFAQFDFDEIITKAKNETFIILSDEAGSGKTVTFKYLAKYIKSKYPLYWVSYIDLKSFTRSFQEDILPDDMISNFLTKTIFEKELFDMAYYSNQMFILWNGFDEISPAFYYEILYVLRYIYYNSNIIQLVCTRPTYSHDLRNAFEQISFKLVPFDATDRKEFITDYIKSKNNYVNGDEKTARTIRRIESLEAKSNASDFNTPLILIMVADIGDNQNALESANLYVIYETFIQKKIDIWKKKTKSSDSFSTKIISGKVNLMKVFQYFALHNEVSDFSTFSLLAMQELEIFKQNYIDEVRSDSEIARIGILHDDDYGGLKLSHKSFIEFLVAQFLIENIYNSDSCGNSKEAKLRIELFFYFSRIYGHSQWLITDFMMDYLSINSKGLGSENITTVIKETSQRNRNNKYSMKNKIQKKKVESFSTAIVESIEQDYSLAFINLLGTDQPQIFEFLFDFFKKDLKVLKVLLQYDEPETLFTAIFNPKNNAYHIDPNMIINLVNKTNVLDESEFEEFVNGRNQEGVMILGMFHYRNEKVQRVHDKFKNINFTSDSTLCDLFDALNSSLTDDQWTYLFTSKAGSIIITKYLYNVQKVSETVKIRSSPLDPAMHVSTSVDTISNDSTCSAYNSFWSVIMNLSSDDLETCFEFSIVKYLEISSSPSYPPDEQQLKFLLNHVKKIFKPKRILIMIKYQNMLHKAALKIENFKILWEFYVDMQKAFEKSEEEYNQEDIEKEFLSILVKNDDGILLFDNFNMTRASKNVSFLYNSHYFDPFRQTILYRGITYSNNKSSFNYYTNIYKKYLSNDQIIDVVTESLVDMVYFLSFAKLEICKEFSTFLGETFENDTEQLKKFLNTEDDGYTIFEIFDNFFKKRLECVNKIYNLIRTEKENDDDDDEQYEDVLQTNDSDEDESEDE